MDYQFTHLKHFFRKILRSETSPGNFKRIVSALVLTILTLLLRQVVSHDLDSLWFLKSCFTIRGEIDPPSNLVIVSIDDESYSKLNLSPRKPFPRNISAKFIEEIQKENPALIILDLHAPKEPDEEDATKALAEALALGPNTLAYSPAGTDEIYDEDFYFSDPLIREASEYEVSMRFNNHLGVVRYIYAEPLNVEHDNYHNSIPLIKPLQNEVDSSIKPPAPFDIINYYGPAGTIRSYSVWEFFSDDRRIPAGYFENKVVLVGFKSEFRERGTTAKEVFNVPISTKETGSNMYGVEIHANIVGNLLEQEWIKRISHQTESYYIFFALFFLILGILLLEPFFALIYMILYLGIWFSVTYILFSYSNFFVPGVYLALFASTIIFSGASCMVATIYLKELRKIKRTFGMDNNS